MCLSGRADNVALVNGGMEEPPLATGAEGDGLVPLFVVGIFSFSMISGRREFTDGSHYIAAAAPSIANQRRDRRQGCREDGMISAPGSIALGMLVGSV